MKPSFFLALALPALCLGFEEDPWYPCFMEFHFDASYDYNFFSHVDNGIPQLRSTYHTHVVTTGLELTAPETWNWQLELELGTTSDVSFHYRSFAVQIRRLWLDDVEGDPISLSTGLVYRDAGATMRKALSTPYHGRANFEFHSAIGREWSRGRYWIFHPYGLFAIGQATSGKPWLRGDLYLGFNGKDLHQFCIYMRSVWGLGKQTSVPLDPFAGWGEIQHQSIDVGVCYRYLLDCYGSLQVDYLRRVYAQSYPEEVNFFLFTFHFPFSLL